MTSNNKEEKPTFNERYTTFWKTRKMELGLLVKPAPWRTGSVFHSLLQQPGVWIPLLGLHLIVIWWHGRVNGAPLLFWHHKWNIALVSGAVVSLTIALFLFVFFILDYSAWIRVKKMVRKNSDDEADAPAPETDKDIGLVHWSERASRHFDSFFLDRAKAAENSDKKTQNRVAFGVMLRRQSFIFRSLTNAFAFLITVIFLGRLVFHFVFRWIPKSAEFADKVIGWRFWNKDPSAAKHGKFDIWNESVQLGDLGWLTFIGGMILGAVCVGLFNASKFYLFPCIDRIKIGEPIPVLSKLDRKNLVWSDKTAMLVYGLWSILLVLIAQALVWSAAYFFERYYAAAAVCIMLAWIVLVYGVIVLIVRRKLSVNFPLLAIVAVVGFVALFFLKDRYGFRNLSSTPDVKNQLPPVRSIFPARGPDRERLRVEAQANREKEIAKIEAGKFWVGSDESAQWNDGPLVVLCASGGGITAEVWVAEILALLGRDLDGFEKNVRIITGASGGMVGAAAWVGARYFDIAEPSSIPEKPLEDRCREDQLSPAAVRFSLYDASVLGFGLQRIGKSMPGDRGEVLEDTWYSSKTGKGVLPELGKTLGELKPREWSGEVPSLIFSPTIAEQGRGLLISNLEVSRVCDLVLPGRTSLREDRVHRAVDGRLLLGNPAIDKTPLTTWARMSATFPLVSPPGYLEYALPGGEIGHLHVVDAAYSDNEGTSLALSWLRNYWMPWARKNPDAAPKDVILIEMDAFPRYGPAAWEKQVSGGGRLSRGMHAVAEDFRIPLMGLQNRSRRHVLHTDRMLQDFGDDVAKEGGGKYTFTSYRFVNPIPASLSWYLSVPEREGLRWFSELFNEIDTKALNDPMALIKKANDACGLELPPVATDDSFLIYSLREYEELLEQWKELVLTK